MANGLDSTGGEEVELMELADILGCEELDEILEGEGGASDETGDDEPVQFFAEELIWKEIIRGRGENLDVGECDDCIPLDDLIPCRGLDCKTLGEGGGHDFSIGDLGSEVVVLKEDNEDIEFEVIPSHHGEIPAADTEDLDSGMDVEDIISTLREGVEESDVVETPSSLDDDLDDLQDWIDVIRLGAFAKVEKVFAHEIRRDMRVLNRKFLKRKSVGVKLPIQEVARRKEGQISRRIPKLGAKIEGDRTLSLHSEDFDFIPSTAEINERDEWGSVFQ